ncbi:MAG: hypothetical protein EXR01_09340 [Acetobacteraceae bacterium]|nr:hypothetical protein [Acetobacteraceae bacterium]
MRRTISASAGLISSRFLSVSPRVSADALDIDHCFPWAAWPCDDLWNLLPAHRSVNQNQKRDKLPGVELLRSAQDRIQAWWEQGYLKAGNQVLPERFMTEVRATLPVIEHIESKLDDVFVALNLQQMRLRHDQQVPVWDPNISNLPNGV